jgi:formylglycine-generating enzyme required for sulfatase activity
VNDKDRQSDDDRANFDLTTPNIPIQYRDQVGRRPPPSREHDRTMMNEALPKPEGRTNRPPSAQNKYDLTMVNFGATDEDEEAPNRQGVPAPPPYQPYPEPQVQQPVQKVQTPVQPRKGISKWIWLGIGALILLLVCAAGIGVYFLIPHDGFTLRVLNAPSGANVYVDDIPSGVRQRDGTIIVQGLRAGEARDIRVSEQGFADWKTTVTGQSGKVMDLTVNLTPLETKNSQPTEIDYSGRMVLIPAGQFQMGADDSNPEERPMHAVTLPDYYIDKYEVTNEQYGNFCNATGHAKPVNPFWDPQYLDKNPRMPVIGVSYGDAEAYAAWANKRLPTESEWEKAASWGPNASQKRRYPWGDSTDKLRANVDSQHPSTIGQFSNGGSAYGAQDMAGNVREWVNGTFDAYPGNTASNPQFGQGLRVVRGGDFRAGPSFAKTTSRLGVDAGFKTNPGDDKIGRSSLVGFRCAIAADDPKLQVQLKQGSK